MVLDRLFLHCQRLTTLDARALQSYGKGTRGLSTDRGTISDAILSHTPLVDCLRVPVIRITSTILLFCFAVVFLVRHSTLSSDVIIPRFQYYRFTNLETRDPSTPPSSPGIQRFGLLRTGQENVGTRVSGQGQAPLCPVREEDEWVLWDEGASKLLSLEGKGQGRGFDAWYYVTLRGNGTQAEDAVRFKLEGSDDPAFAEPVLVGASTTFVLHNGQVQLVQEGVARTPLERGAVHTIHAADRTLGPADMITTTMLWATLVAVHATAFTRHVRRCKRMASFGLGMQGLLRLCTGTYILASDLSWEGGRAQFVRYYFAAISLFMSVLILEFYERHLEWTFLVFGIGQSFAHVVIQYFILTDIPSSVASRNAVETDLPWWSSTALIFLLIVCTRINVVVREWLAIQADILFYEEVWGRVRAGQTDSLKALARIVRELEKQTAGRVPRQLNCRIPSGQVVPRRLSFMQGRAGGKARRKSSLFSVSASELFGPGGGSDSLRRFSVTSVSSEREHPTDSPLGQTPTGSPILSARPLLRGGGRVAPSGVPGGQTKRKMSLLGSGFFNSSLMDLTHDVSRERECFLCENVLQSAKLANALKWCLSGHTLGHGKPVDSLDQLLAQAFMVQNLFLDLVVELAGNCNGKFKLKRMVDDVSDFEVASWGGGEDSRARFELGGMKSIHSASRKATVVFGGDVSMLLDMVRETLYFDTVADLAGCLEQLQSHPLLEVVKVKSTFNVATTNGRLGSSGWAGMRFVSVNVRLVACPEARELCVDLHICELLLVLTDIGRVQTDAMKQRYRKWRIVRKDFPHAPLALCVLGCGVGVGGCFKWLASMLDFGKAKSLCNGAAHARGRHTSINSVMSSDKSGSLGHTLDEAGSKRESRDLEENSLAISAPPGIALQSPQLLHVRTGGGGSDLDRSIHTRRESQKLSAAPQVAFIPEESQPAAQVTSWGVSVCGDMLELLQGLCHMSVLGLFDFVDKRWELVVDYSRADKSSFSSILFSQNPVSAACHRWQFQIMALMVGCFYAYMGFQGIKAREVLMGEYSFGPYKHYRLETMLTRNGSERADVWGPGVSDFGVLGLSRCAPTLPVEQPSFSGPVGSSFVVSFPEGRSMTGWYLRSGAVNGSEPQDPKYFDVWATNDDIALGDGSCALARADGRWWERGDTTDWCGGRWVQVGSPKWGFMGFMRDGKAWDFRKIGIELPLDRGLLQTFILRPAPEEFDYAHIYNNFAGTMAGVFTVVAGVVSNHFPGVPPPPLVLGFHVGVRMLLMTSGAFVAIRMGQIHLVLEYFTKAVPDFFIVAMCLRQGPWVRQGLAAIVVVSFVGSIMLSLYSHSVVVLPSGIGMAFFGLSLLFLRALAIRRSKRLVREDQARYDRLYTSLVQAEDSKVEIEHLGKVVQMIGLDEKNNCQQYNHLLVSMLPPRQRTQHYRNSSTQIPVNPLFLDLDRVFIPGRTDPDSKVTSINQLYASAAISFKLMCPLIKAWAEKSDGMFKLRNRGGVSSDASSSESEPVFVKWNDVKGDADKMQQIVFPTLKRFGRAVEKLLRSYGHDPSKLLDICRHCIIFATVSDLTRALGSIITDENVRVERLKNRLSPDHSSDETAGYRDVCLNLRVVNEAALSLGVDTHMCEVQLILLDFAKLRTSEGHKRYVEARNQLGV